MHIAPAEQVYMFLIAIYSAGINSSGTGGGPMARGYENIRRTNVLDSFMPVHVGPPKTTT